MGVASVYVLVRLNELVYLEDGRRTAVLGGDHDHGNRSQLGGATLWRRRRGGGRGGGWPFIRRTALIAIGNSGAGGRPRQELIMLTSMSELLHSPI